MVVYGEEFDITPPSHEIVAKYCIHCDKYKPAGENMEYTILKCQKCYKEHLKEYEKKFGMMVV
jgi:hypothetical protein